VKNSNLTQKQEKRLRMNLVKQSLRNENLVRVITETRNALTAALKNNKRTHEREVKLDFIKFASTNQGEREVKGGSE
jgi:hypothetical protein